MPFARCHGAGRVHYAERGEARPGRSAALLIHGAGGSSAIWMMVMARLARVTRVVAIDLPGHGPSPVEPGGGEPARAVTLEDHRDACGELAARVGLGPSVLVGHSMGALIAIQAALAWPDKVTGLVLCGAAPRLPVGQELLDVIESDYARFPAWLAERAFSPAARPALRRGFVAAGVAAPQPVTRADFAALASVDLGPRLREIACPVVWLDGADDQIVQIVQIVGGVGPAAGRPGEARRLGGVGHLVPIEAPGAVAEAVATILQAV